jgi:peptidoglycan-associated lipoprotein
MVRKFAMLSLLAFATAAGAQVRLPVIFPLRGAQPAPPPGAPVAPGPPGALQADLVVKAGSDTVYFAPRGYAIDANAAATLSAQARWLQANPFATVRLEGHGDARDTRDYALAIGDRRANAVRDFLVLQGVAPERISVTSWGKERPGSVRIGPSIVAAGPRVVTKIQ